MKDMNNYSTYDGNDYRAPWLRLNKEQMSDPFGWLLSQRNIDVMAILLKMGYNDRQIGFLLYPNQIADKKPGFLQMRQRIGQKAVQTYLKWVFDNEVKKNKIKLGESQLRQIVAESVKNVLSEIDWKTANRAADIQSKWEYNGRRGGWDRYRKFRDYSDDEANLKFFGQKGGVDFIRDNDNDEGVSWVGFNLGYPQVRINDRDKFGAECKIVPTCIDYCHVNPDTLCAIEKFTDDGSSYYRGISNEDVRKYFGEESELYQRFMEAVQEYTDLKNYKYRYDDKQGWHLKESVEKTVKSVLKEYLNKK